MSCKHSDTSWSSENDEILIAFVRNHEAIYNAKSKEYRKTQMKQRLWREIGDILNKTDSDCSKRWCYIRDYYIRRRGKPGTGSSREAAKKRSDLLSFLDCLPSSQRSSITNVVDNSVIIEDFICDNNDALKNNNKPIQLKDDTGKNNKKRKHNAHSQERLSLHKQIANRNSNELDENDLFFSSMVKIVKKLPPYEQVQIRLQIGSIVGNAELRQISNNSRPSTSNSDYYEIAVPSPKSTTSTMNSDS